MSCFAFLLVTGKTRDEAQKNIREAIELYREPHPSDLEGVAADN
jgi:predicted RNase H-like HicB family nuclease